MLVQIVTKNGQKKIIPLTADAGAGLPVGTIVSMYKKSSPSGYLYCDGSTFDATQYPLLYAYLGSNVLPDYREFALVGAEENTTDVYNASTNPTGTIHDHDVYTEGQAKDDQLQTITGSFSPWAYKSALAPDGAFKQTGTSEFGYGAPQTNDGSKITFNSGNVTRSGDVTRGKRKAVYFYIKATSGLTEGQQDDVANIINGERSYSTSEVNTGKKWIDGKPIYRIVFELSQNLNDGEELSIPNCETIISQGGNFVAPWGGSNTHLFPQVQDNNNKFFFDGLTSRGMQLIAKWNGSSSYIGTGSQIIFEYTKTT